MFWIWEIVDLMLFVVEKIGKKLLGSDYCLVLKAFDIQNFFV